MLKLQLRQSFFRVKPFQQKKARKIQILAGFFRLKKTSTSKSQNLKIWLQKIQVGNPEG